MLNEQTIDHHRKPINWPITIFMLLFHIGAIAALFNFSWPALGVGVLMWWIAGSLGIGIGYHRLLTHRGFNTPKFVEYFLTLCGTLALQGGPIGWVATHRVHHANTEQDGDPHSPREGFWWSHMGWIVNGQSTHSEVVKLNRYVPDLTKDPFLHWLSKWSFVTQIPLMAVLYWAGGWPFILWGVCLRVVFSWHATCFVNSAAHVWGSRGFETRDDSRNNWWVALMSFGEGWHNNHHAFPAAARHGLAWYQIDVNWYSIWVMKKLGLARNVRLADPTIYFKDANPQTGIDATSPG
ncbi:MAG: fatty acid desaturase [Acidobacteria bacterium]|nr:fatty acid desaturase [Acidobacteriota bacterium]